MTRAVMARVLALLLLPPGGPPAFAMLPNPIEQGAFETDVIPQTLRLEPLVL
ncbi:MAG: hypothetical protein Q7S40_10765 [Opitutaceae bacterium]|nr:hypothetical protein [Opitutaceae bacterium]